MTCHVCNASTRITDIVCPSCHELLLMPFSNPPEEEEVEDANDNISELLDSLKRFVPTLSDKFIRCGKCGQENVRGERVCCNCSYPLAPSTVLEETVMIDDDVIKNLSPRLKEAFFKLGCSLLVLEVLKKTEKYPCETVVDDKTGKICGNMISFKDKYCTVCGGKNSITYNCTNYDDEKSPCKQRISLEMMKCPTCGTTTLLSDLVAIASGSTRGEESIECISKHIQPYFQYFTLMKATLPCMIEQRDLVDMVFNSENMGMKGSTIYEWLATYLRIATSRQTSISMPTSLSSLGMMLQGQGSSLQRSPQMNDLYARREQESREVPPVAPQADAAAAADAGDDDDGDDDDIDNPDGWGRI